MNHTDTIDISKTLFLESPFYITSPLSISTSPLSSPLSISSTHSSPQQDLVMSPFSPYTSPDGQPLPMPQQQQQQHHHHHVHPSAVPASDQQWVWLEPYLDADPFASTSAASMAPPHQHYHQNHPYAPFQGENEHIHAFPGYSQHVSPSCTPHHASTLPAPPSIVPSTFHASAMPVYGNEPVHTSPLQVPMMISGESAYAQHMEKKRASRRKAVPYANQLGSFTCAPPAPSPTPALSTETPSSSSSASSFSSLSTMATATAKVAAAAMVAATSSSPISSHGSHGSPSVQSRPTRALVPKRPPPVYPCDFDGCTKTFTRPYNLKSHRRTHTNEKPFDCPHCDMKFARQHDRNRHAKLHVGVKPFVCIFCLKSFARQDALNRHQKWSPSVDSKKPDALPGCSSLQRKNRRKQPAK